MKEITVKVYQYSELSDKAKEKARQWYLEGQDFSFEWDNIVEDAKNIGLKLTAWDYGRYCKGDLLSAAETVCDKIMKEHGEQCETYKTAKEYCAQFDALLPLYEANAPEYDDKYQDLVNNFTEAILEDYRIIADRQSDDCQSEEYIADAMKVIEYTFLENGKRF